MLKSSEMPTLHLIAGLPCSGKTTYATALRGDLNCALFSLDRWLITSFGRYAIASVGQEEHTRRVLACRELIWDAASELLHRSVDVIFDDGFFLRDHRAAFGRRATVLGVRTKIHFIDTPFEVLRARLDERNSSLPPFNFRIDPELLRAFQALFEAPSDAEGAEVVVVREFGHPRTHDIQ
jgi:predicted kinase